LIVIRTIITAVYQYPSRKGQIKGDKLGIMVPLITRGVSTGVVVVSLSALGVSVVEEPLIGAYLADSAVT
jgi:hypothetical protein